MKNKIIMVSTGLLVLLAGCGSNFDNDPMINWQPPAAVDISNNTVLWEGKLDERNDLVVTNNWVNDCFITWNLQYTQLAYPKVVIVDSRFVCSGVGKMVGCYVRNTETIYLSQDVSGSMYQSMYHVLAHELVHWRTGVDGESTYAMWACGSSMPPHWTPN